MPGRNTRHLGFRIFDSRIDRNTIENPYNMSFVDIEYFHFWRLRHRPYWVGHFEFQIFEILKTTASREFVL